MGDASVSKRLKNCIIAATVLCLTSAAGMTLAFMFKKAERTNRFIPAEVSCTVREKLDNAEVGGIAAVGGVKSDIRAENTGNIKEFIRLRLVSYYVNENGDIAGTAASKHPNLTLKNGWIAGANHTFYYPYPVEPGKATEILCEPIPLGKTQLENSTTVYQVIEVIAEAVQAEPLSAAQEAWGVTVTNGIITTTP